MMKMKKQIRRVMPASWKRAIKTRGEIKELRTIRKLECDTENLRSMSDVDLRGLLYSAELESNWNDSKKKIDMFAIPDGTGGTNPGDRRAIY